MPAEAAPAAPAAPSLISPPAAPAPAPGAPPVPGAPPAPPPPAPPAAPAGAVGESFWRGWIKDTGEFDAGRYDHLPEGLKESREMLARYKTPEDLLKSFVDTKRLATSKTLVPPADTAPEADKQAFDAQVRKIFGVPEKPEGYGIQKPADVPDNLWDAEYAGEMAKVLHANAIPPKAVAAIVAANNRLQQGAIAKVQQAQEAEGAQQFKVANDKLNAQFGRDRPQMEKLALNVAKQLGIPTGQGSEFEGNADMIILAAKYAVAVGEDKFVGGDSKGVNQSPMEEMKAMTQDPQNRYYAVLRTPNAHSAAHPLNGLWREADRRLTELAKQQAALQGPRR